MLSCFLISSDWSSGTHRDERGSEHMLAALGVKGCDRGTGMEQVKERKVYRASISHSSLLYSYMICQNISVLHGKRNLRFYSWSKASLCIFSSFRDSSLWYYAAAQICWLNTDFPGCINMEMWDKQPERGTVNWIGCRRNGGPPPWGLSSAEMHFQTRLRHSKAATSIYITHQVSRQVTARAWRTPTALWVF